MSTCKYCGAPIAWTRIRERWRATNADASLHLCRPPRARLNETVSKLIVGANYVPACGQCSIPPWEFCPCSVQLVSA